MGVLVVIALFTALIAPYFIDWTAYKREFEEQASRIFGQEVMVGGNAEVRLLPLPSLAFSDLSVGRNRDGSPMLSVERFSAHVELMPFLSGEIRIVDMQLDAPRFHFEVDETGAIEWTNRKQLLVNPDQVKLDKLSVRNGGFSVSGLAGGRTLTGSNVEADISAQSLYGPWRIEGAGLVGARETRFAISLGTYNGGEPLRLKVNSRVEGLPYALEADGGVSVRDDVLIWEGKFDVSPDQDAEQDESALPVNIDGAFALNPKELVISQYRSEIGSADDPFVVTGLGGMSFKDVARFRLEVDGRQIDVNRIASMQQGEGAVATTLESRLAVLREIVDRVPVPPLDGEISLEIPAIIAGDTHIREVSAVLEPFGHGWKIARLKSQLPGNTLVEASGRLGTGEDFGFTGSALIASHQPSGFAAWAVGEVDPSIRKLSVAGLSGEVTLTANQVGIDQLELFLNQDRLQGSIKRLAPISDDDGSKPAIIADLSGNVVAVDALKAIGALAFGNSNTELGAQTLAHDFDVKLKANRFEGFGLSVSGLDTQFQYKDDALSIVALNAEDFYGVTLSSRGRIADLLGAAEGNLAVTAKADDFVDLSNYLLTHLPGSAILEALALDPSLSSGANLEVEVDARGNAEEGTSGARSRIVANGKMGGTEVIIRAGIRGNLSKWEDMWVDLSGEFSNPDPAMLAAQSGLRRYGFTDLYNTIEGPLRISLESVGERQKGWSTLVNADLPGTVLSAKGLVEARREGGVSQSFDVTLGAENIVPLVGSFGYLLPGLNVISSDAAPFSFNGKITRDHKGAASIDIASASIGGNAVTGNLELGAPRGGAPVRLGGALKLDQLNASLLAAGIAGIDPALIDLGGFSLDEESAFSGFVVGDIVARLHINADRLQFPGDNEAREATFELIHTPGKTEISNLVFKFGGGRVSASGVLAEADQSAVLSGQVNAADIELKSLASSLGLAPRVAGRGDISTTIEANGKTPRAFTKSVSGNGVVVFREAVIEGVRSEGLEQVLKASDAEGFEVSASAVGRLVEEAFLTGSMPVGAGSASFNIRNGEIGIRNAIIGEKPPGASRPVHGDLSYGLSSGDLVARLQILPDPGKDGVEGGAPEFVLEWQGNPAGYALTTQTSGLEGFLSIRAFEAEQRKVEMLQAAILEKQRFRRDLLNSGERGRWLQAKRLAELKRIEEAARLEAEIKAREEAERQRKADEAARKEAERLEAERRAAEAQRRAEEAAKQQAQEVETAPLTPLPENNAGNSPGAPRNLFDNLEKLLVPQNSQ